MREKIIELHNLGYSQKEIALSVGCSVTNVGYHLNQKIRLRVNRKRREDRLRAMEFLKIKCGGKCKICGYSKCLKALDFHHINPNNKIESINILLKRYSFSKAQKEIKKCVLLCCRCHREVHEGIVHLS